MNRRKRPSKETLVRLYAKEGQSLPGIASHYGVIPRTVGKWLALYGIESRLAQKKRILHGISKEQLEQWYLVEMKTTPQIAEIVGTSHKTILNYLRRYGIPVRGQSEAQRLQSGTLSITDSFLCNLYKQGKSQSEIAEMVGLSQTAVGFRLRKSNVSMRGKANIGAKNGMYGRTHTAEAREKIRAANKRQFSDPEARKRHAILTCQQIQSGRTGKAYNKLERRVADWLAERGVAYIQQYRVGTYIFDFFLPNPYTLIEVQGRFWHADPRFYDPEHLSSVQKHNIQNDIRKAVYAIQHGFCIRYFWEDDIMSGAIAV